MRRRNHNGAWTEKSLEKMKELGATMTTTEMFLFEEMGGADHETFGTCEDSEEVQMKYTCI